MDLLRAGHVEEAVGLAVERLDLRLGHPVAAAVGIAAAKRPPVGEAVLPRAPAATAAMLPLASGDRSFSAGS